MSCHPNWRSPQNDVLLYVSYGLEFVVKRGQVTTVPFTADKAGIFRVVCTVHQPTMTGTLVVLPR